MSPPRFSKITAVVVGAALWGACGAGTEESDRPPLGTADSAGAAVTTPSTSAAEPHRGTDGEFPIPTPHGGVVITDEWSGSTGHVTLRYPANRYDEIVAFYDDYASGSGWNRSEIGQGPVPSVNQMNLMRGWNIAIDPPIGDHLVVTLTVS